MRGAIPPLRQYAFMAWCLVKHRDNFIIAFYGRNHKMKGTIDIASLNNIQMNITSAVEFEASNLRGLRLIFFHCSSTTTQECDPIYMQIGDGARISGLRPAFRFTAGAHCRGRMLGLPQCLV